MKTIRETTLNTFIIELNHEITGIYSDLRANHVNYDIDTIENLTTRAETLNNVVQRLNNLIDTKALTVDKGDNYYYISNTTGITMALWTNHPLDYVRLRNDNVFLTYDEAETARNMEDSII